MAYLTRTFTLLSCWVVIAHSLATESSENSLLFNRKKEAQNNKINDQNHDEENRKQPFSYLEHNGYSTLYEESIGYHVPFTFKPEVKAEPLQQGGQYVYAAAKIIERELERSLIWDSNDPNRYENVSAQCGKDLLVLDAAKSRPDVYSWSLIYMNAGAKDEWPAAGLFDGNAWVEGSHDMCMQIKATNEDVYSNHTGTPQIVGKHSFDAHYCKAQWYRPGFRTGFSESWCLPKSCDRSDVLALMNDKFSPVLPEKYSYCGTKPDFKKDVGAWVAIVITALFVLLVALATVVDGINTWREEQEVEQMREAMEMSEIGGKSADYKGIVDYTPAQPGAPYRAFMCFSLYKNFPTITATGGSRATYGCMNGLRFFAMAWIAVGHVESIGKTILLNPQTTLIKNMLGQFDYKGRFFHQLLNNMNLSVDIFFFLGGTLATISFMKTIKKMSKMTNMQRMGEIILHVFHRYWRLTPAVAAMLLIVPNLYIYFSDGPLFPEWIAQTQSCKKNWWSLLLYIQNLYRGPDQQDCLPWTWYLANDFQFYVILPVFATALYVWPSTFGPLLLFLAWLGTTIARAVLVSSKLKDGYWELYVKPWARFGPYAMGIYFGYILYKIKGKRVKMPLPLVWFGWLVSTLVVVLIIFGTWQRGDWPGATSWSIPENRAYNILRRDGFALCLAWTVFCCVNGYGGLLNTFLSWDFFTILSKLTYCGYLVHPMVHVVLLTMRHNLLYAQDMTLIYQSLAVLTLSLAISVPFTLLFEVPFMKLEKIILPKHR